MNRGDGGYFIDAILVLAVMVLCIFIAYSHSQIRDLQRRVGQLESERR